MKHPLQIECPTCHSAPGKHCYRPSGHRIFGGGVHSSRELLARTGISKDQVKHAGDAAHTGGVYRPGIKVRYFRVVDAKGLTRHGRQLPKGSRFWVKKSSSSAHVDRWLEEGRIAEVAR